MNPVQVFMLIFAALAGIVFYVAAFILPEPPFWVSLSTGESVRVVTSTVETRRRGKMPARPQIEVRDMHGDLTLVQGYPWMGVRRASQIVDTISSGAVIEVFCWNGKLWVGIAFIGDWILLAISLLAAFFVLFGLGMALKLRFR
jgi:hypothetical protein